jgi:hypothetical protein
MLGLHHITAKIVDTSASIITAFDQLSVQLRTLGEEYMPLGIVALYQVRLCAPLPSLVKTCQTNTVLPTSSCSGERRFPDD